MLGKGGAEADEPLSGGYVKSAFLSMIKFIGAQSRTKVDELMGMARAGIVVYHPTANHMEAMPNKLFEFMAAGLPVICSDFPLWKRLIEENGCGRCVTPLDAGMVRQCCEQMLDDYENSQRMGKRGRELVEKKYNWNCEEKKLLRLYQEVIGR